MFGLFKRKKQAFQNIDLPDFETYRTQKRVVVLDVRSPKEIAAGAIPGHKAINISDSNFREEVNKLDKSATYLVYCKSGMRSAKACRVMSDLGFESLYNFKGGITAWNARK